MKVVIKYKKKIPYGYVGMNKLASKLHHISWKYKKHPEHIIEIKKGLPKKIRKHTENHEKYEIFRMKELIKKGYSSKKAYHIAHPEALKFEQLDKPFPRKDIKRKLIKWGILR
jgi:hypothetical protein